MATAKQGVPVNVPYDVWQPLMEVRSQLDSACPGAPTPIEELLRELVNHYKHCENAVAEAEDFCKRAQAWKKGH
ncbi:MAG TPA: hypothetical protein VFE91_07760 [Nitrososphaerales archaeon]|nr:hypothetical protein [Nitrososphaerales archaeon]